jgi:DNA polymerase III delta subunit
MITIVHGNDILTSRKFFLDQKTDSSVFFDAETESTTYLAQLLNSSGLFSDSNEIVVLIENLFGRKGIKNIDALKDVADSYLKANIFIWADKEVPAKTLATFPKFNNQIFKIPQNIWAFLDGIRPNNPGNIVSFHSALKSCDADYLFLMIIRQFRLLIGISSNSSENADEVKRLAPWQKTKLTKQSSLFTLSQLKNVYTKLYNIDKAQKTGATSLTLTQNIDFLLLDI